VRLWVTQVYYSGELTCSTHLTEKGALLRALADVFCFLGVDDEVQARITMRDKWGGNMDNRPTDEEVTKIWDVGVLKTMESSQLWKIFSKWNMCTWDNYDGYTVDINRVMLEA
tara:strand:- start:718 stop:1056 length:339 start_codon:yes stop_codon:yes gene_type:complete